MNQQQLPLFIEATPKLSHNLISESGTFKESMRAPIHNWFRYPAGFSYKFVEQVFQENKLSVGNMVYDPFSGTGTTLLCAKQSGLNAYGVEAHTFVHWVASVKLDENYNFSILHKIVDVLLCDCKTYMNARIVNINIQDVFPELVYKCYHPLDLKELYLIREFLNQQTENESVVNLLKLALTDTLRSAAAAGTGWPYIAPRKNTGDKPPKGAFQLFENRTQKMCKDILSNPQHTRKAEIENVLGDSRVRQSLFDQQVDLALTSPPYLNNYDYADRTRLETYFWGITRSWSDITKQFREKLIVAATTQVIRSKYDVETALSKEFCELDPSLYEQLQSSILELAILRKTKGGKKDYDLMVALYFNDILAVLRETYRVLKKGGSFYLVLGDSAPYGVYIPTDHLIGRLGLALGFKDYNYIEFRKRGGKWKDNPQRHDVKLREGLVILRK